MKTEEEIILLYIILKRIKDKQNSEFPNDLLDTAVEILELILKYDEKNKSTREK